MFLETDYCFTYPDPYSIITSIYYIIFGMLGLFVNNSYLNDIHAFLIITGISAILEFSGVLEEFYYFPLTICSGMICNKLLSESIKLWSERNIYGHNKILGIDRDKFYRLFSSFSCLIVYSYSCLTIFYYNVFFIIAILIFIQVIVTINIFKYYPSSQEYYTKTRLILRNSLIGLTVGCVGLGTSIVCAKDNWLWLRLFIGYPIANLGISYFLYTISQIVLLLRGKNLSRHIAMKGDNLVFIAYFAGRK